MAESQVQVRKYVLWLPNPEPGRDVPRSFHNRILVLPSHVGQNSPLSECQTRAKIPCPGTYEKCVLILSGSGSSYAAYPVADTETHMILGVVAPVEITWEANEQEPGVIATIYPEGCPSYFRVFPGLNERHDTIVPQAYSTVPWEKPPQAGETTLCWVAWHVGEKSTVGYAYPHTDAIKIDVQHGVSFLPGVGLFIPKEMGWNASAKWQGEEVVITLTPRS